jgi:hypothetical protein
MRCFPGTGVANYPPRTGLNASDGRLTSHQFALAIATVTPMSRAWLSCKREINTSEIVIPITLKTGRKGTRRASAWGCWRRNWISAAHVLMYKTFGSAPA